MNKYRELKERNEKKLNNFPMGFAFSRKQLEEVKLKLNVAKCSELLSIGCGGFIRKKDQKAFDELFSSIDKELRDAIFSDTTGEGFALDALSYELSNHEYCISLDPTDALEELGITIDDIRNSEALSHAYKLAIKLALEE